MLDVHESPLFNWKPYWGHVANNTSILHFHGAKATDYLAPKSAAPGLRVLMNLCRAQRELCDAHVGLWTAFRRAAESEANVRGRTCEGAALTAGVKCIAYLTEGPWRSELEMELAKWRAIAASPSPRPPKAPP